MRIGVEMRQTTQQGMVLLPRMLQSIEVLQLSQGALEELVQKSLAENEVLRVREGAKGTLRRRAAMGLGGEDSDRALAQTPAQDGGLHDALRQQVALAGLGAELEAAVLHVVEHIDPETGWLTASADQLALHPELRCSAERWDEAIAFVQTLEPRGVGGRGGVECLLLQLDENDAVSSMLRRVLRDFLEDVSKNRLPKVARRLGVSVEELRHGLEHLRGMPTRPGEALRSEAAPGLVPDVALVDGPDGWEVRVEDASLPVLELDEELVELCRDRALPDEARSYLRTRIDTARGLLDAVAQRRATLARVARALFEEQREFLLRGPEHIAPLRMQDLANQLDLHVSTVSRAVADKWAATPWGSMPLRAFFGGGTKDEDGREVSRVEIRAALRRLVQAEDPGHPRSDEELVQLLESAHGLSVARRTVTKYRKELGIPSSWRRRRHVSER